MNNPPLIENFGGTASTQVTLRDLLAGLVAGPLYHTTQVIQLDLVKQGQKPHYVTPADVAHTAYGLADAMLEAREPKTQ